MKFKINFAIVFTVIGLTGCGSSSDIISSPASETKVESKTTESKTIEQEQSTLRNYETIEKKMNKAGELRLINTEKPGQ